MERLCSGQTWSGQFPLRKKNGEIFMALVTKNPVYEDGELAGIVTVSSDAKMFNSSMENLRERGDRSNGQPRLRGSDINKLQWQSRPQIAAPVAQISSSVSNLVLKCCIILFSCSN